jgi:hypothetical protein
MDYVELLIDEWCIPEQQRRLRACLGRVLAELEAGALLTLRREPKLVVMVCRDLTSEVDHIWAYFPMHPRLQTPKLRIPERGTEAELASALRAATDDVYRRRLIAQQYKPKPTTRVLLVFSEPMIAKQPASVTEDQMRDHLGHTLLYLRSPKARNECADSLREWRGNTRRVARRQ